MRVVGCENQSLCVSLQALEDNVHISLVCNDRGNVHQLVSQDARVVDGHVFDDRVVIIGHEEAQIGRLTKGWPLQAQASLPSSERSVRGRSYEDRW